MAGSSKDCTRLNEALKTSTSRLGPLSAAYKKAWFELLTAMAKPV